jgi:hypothetical protein
MIKFCCLKDEKISDGPQHLKQISGFSTFQQVFLTYYN